MERLNVSPNFLFESCLFSHPISPDAIWTCLWPVTACWGSTNTREISLNCVSQGYCIKNTRLVVRYPDRRPQKVIPVPLKTCLPVTQQAGLAAGSEPTGLQFQTFTIATVGLWFDILYSFLSSDHDGVDQWMEMSVTSGEQLAAILGTTATTNTFLIRKARTGSPGSLKISLRAADWTERLGAYGARFCQG